MKLQIWGKKDSLPWMENDKEANGITILYKDQMSCEFGAVNYVRA